MMVRVYLSKVVGDGLTEITAYRPAWTDVVPMSAVSSHGVIDERKYKFWIGQIDTTDEQHTALVADANVRWLNDAALDLSWAQLSAAQRAKAAEIVAWLGFEPRGVADVFSASAKVRDLVFWLVGKSCWKALKTFEE